MESSDKEIKLLNREKIFREAEEIAKSIGCKAIDKRSYAGVFVVPDREHQEAHQKVLEVDLLMIQNKKIDPQPDMEDGAEIYYGKYTGVKVKKYPTRSKTDSWEIEDLSKPYSYVLWYREYSSGRLSNRLQDEETLKKINSDNKELWISYLSSAEEERKSLPKDYQDSILDNFNYKGN